MVRMRGRIFRVAIEDSKIGKVGRRVGWVYANWRFEYLPLDCSMSLTPSLRSDKSEGYATVWRG